MIKLYCSRCGKFMAEVRDASIRNGMVVYCADCDKPQTYFTSKLQDDIRNVRGRNTSYDATDFLQGIFK